jgi:hypothetical protein
MPWPFTSKPPRPLTDEERRRRLARDQRLGIVAHNDDRLRHLRHQTSAKMAWGDGEDGWRAVGAARPWKSQGDEAWL